MIALVRHRGNRVAAQKRLRHTGGAPNAIRLISSVLFAEWNKRDTPPNSQRTPSTIPKPKTRTPAPGFVLNQDASVDQFADVPLRGVCRALRQRRVFRGGQVSLPVIHETIDDQALAIIDGRSRQGLPPSDEPVRQWRSLIKYYLTMTYKISSGLMGSSTSAAFLAFVNWLCPVK